MKVAPPDVPMPGMAGGAKANACARKPGEALVEAAHDNVGSQSFRRALVPRFQRDEIKALIARVGKAQEAEANDGVVHLNARRLLQIASICLATSSVRSNDAAGSCTFR